MLRSRSGIRGPGQFWKYGGIKSKKAKLLAGLGQPEDMPIMFYNDPSEVAYQTYPGRFLGQASGSMERAAAWSSALLVIAGAGSAYLGSTVVKDRTLKNSLTILGVVLGGAGVVGAISTFSSRMA